MPLNIRGDLTDERQIRVGFIGCGSHAFRNILPAFQFAPVELIATCDLNAEKAAAYARQFGAPRSYSNHRQMLEKEDLDAVFIVTNYDEEGRPRYLSLAGDCLRAGKHVWIEKPPAARVEDIRLLQSIAGGLSVMVGFKKMFIPANEKAYELSHAESFGGTSLAVMQYPQWIPTQPELQSYLHDRKNLVSVVGFLDHLCHPASLLVYLMGMPETLFYQRSANGAGVATFTFANSSVATLALTHGSANNGGSERTVLFSSQRGQVIVENNIRVTYVRDAVQRPYGVSPTFFGGDAAQTTAQWEPEFSLGQLYNKGLFLLGYCGEINEFARSILEKRPLAKCHLEHAAQVTRIFEGFAEGPAKIISLAK